MARIIPDVSGAFGMVRPQRQKFLRAKAPKRSGTQEAADIMRLIQSGVGTAAGLYGLGRGIYEDFKETDEEALARVQKESLESNLARRKAQLDFAGRELKGVPEAISTRQRVADRFLGARQDLMEEATSPPPMTQPGAGLTPGQIAHKDTPIQVPPQQIQQSLAMDKAAAVAAADDVPVLDVMTLRDVVSRLSPAAAARMRRRIKGAIQSGDVRMPSSQEEAIKVYEGVGPDVRMAVERAITGVRARDEVMPPLEQLDELIAEREYTTDDLVLLAQNASSPEEVRRISEAADDAIDVVPSTHLPGALDAQGRDLAAIIAARRKVLEASPRSFGAGQMSLKERLDIALKNERLLAAQDKRTKKSKRGKGRRSPAPLSVWRDTFKLFNYKPEGRRSGKLTGADRKDFVQQVREGAFGDPASVMERIKSETGLDVSGLYIEKPKPDKPKESEAQKRFKGQKKSLDTRASKLRERKNKATRDIKTRLNQLKSYGAHGIASGGGLAGVKNLPSADSGVEAITDFVKSIRREILTESPKARALISDVNLDKVLNGLISAAQELEAAAEEERQVVSGYAGVMNPFGDAPAAKETPPPKRGVMDELIDMLPKVGQTLPTHPGKGVGIRDDGRE